MRDLVCASFAAGSSPSGKRGSAQPAPRRSGSLGMLHVLELGCIRTPVRTSPFSTSPQIQCVSPLSALLHRVACVPCESLAGFKAELRTATAVKESVRVTVVNTRRDKRIRSAREEQELERQQTMMRNGRSHPNLKHTSDCGYLQSAVRTFRARYSQFI